MRCTAPHGGASRAGRAARTTVHGFRSSFRRRVSERTDADHPVMELCLAHTVPGSLGSGASRARPPVAPLAGFSLEPPLVVSVAAIDRVRGACHVIVARPAS